MEFGSSCLWTFWLVPRDYTRPMTSSGECFTRMAPSSDCFRGQWHDVVPLQGINGAIVWMWKVNGAIWLAFGVSEWWKRFCGRKWQILKDEVDKWECVKGLRRRTLSAEKRENDVTVICNYNVWCSDLSEVVDSCGEWQRVLRCSREFWGVLTIVVRSEIVVRHSR